MKKLSLILGFALLALLVCVGSSFAGADLYRGDTAIYNGDPDTSPLPNVMFVIDNTQGMQQQGVREIYSHGTTYPGTGTLASPAPYLPGALYERQSATGGGINYNKRLDDLSSITCTGAKEALEKNGSYFGPLRTNKGDCEANQNGNFFIGNQLNYSVTPVVANATWGANKAFEAGAIITQEVGGKKYFYEALVSGTSGGGEPVWPTGSGASVVDFEITWALSSDLMTMVKTTVKQVADAAKDVAKFGLMTFESSGNKGGRLLVSIEHFGGRADTAAEAAANQGAFEDAIDDLVAISGNSTQPVNEILWDAGLYFQGATPFTTNAKRIATFGADDASIVSPIEAYCQKNFIIMLTTGSGDDSGNMPSTYLDDLVPQKTLADGTPDPADPAGLFVDDVVKYLNSPDQTGSAGIGTLTSGSINNTEGIQTYIVQLMTSRIERLAAAASQAIGGIKDGYKPVSNNSELVAALYDALTNIVLETDTAFVAPVVPTSPENRTYSGQRVYLGFFYPKNDEPWYGNLKKFGISAYGEITDKNDLPATEANGNFKDVDNGSASTASSFWSSGDAGRVDEGGVGEILKNRGIARNIYTYLTPSNSGVGVGSNKADLTLAQNSFTTGNPNIKFDSTLGVADVAEKNKLIQFLHGLDSYDDNGNSDTTEKRPWIMGDILHSKPLVVNYTSYTFSTANEKDCAVNKGTVFVGANDGMLHAFADCNGEERWAFIPPEVLPNLQNLRGEKHTYFVDGTPVPYKYDVNNDGNIVAADGDRVLLLFGMRRGGEAYYALDVTDPDKPKYLWQVDSSTGFPELGQTWSTPNLGKVRDAAGKPMVVAFVGAGYDNINEDGRWGNTQDFTDVVVTTEESSGLRTSIVNGTGVTPVINPQKGRGVYAIKIVDLDATTGLPKFDATSFASSGTNAWDFVYNDTTPGTNRAYNSAKLTYSIPSDITVLDTDYDGYVDRLYAGDTGGQMWRFSAHDDDNAIDGIDPNRPYLTPRIDKWLGKQVFRANGAGTGSDVGRKIFYRPSVTLEGGGKINLYFGTGDRAHPLNTAVKDRIYSIFDKGQVTSEAIDEGDIYDATYDDLQEDGSSTALVISILNKLSSSANYGWRIVLDDPFHIAGHEGEKVLAPALAFNKVAYYTTYAPSTIVNSDPCLAGNLGQSRLYAVDYLTGEAVLNFDKTNDAQTTTNNDRAEDGNGGVLRDTDRSVDLGIGIPSGIVVLMPPGGDATLLIGCGGGLCTEDPIPGGTIYPIYWRPY